MATINLLPWREEFRQEKQKEFLGILGVVLVAALLAVFGWHLWVNNDIENQRSRNDLLTKEIKLLDQKVKEIKELKKRRQQLLDRMEVIQGLQGNRPDIVRVFDELVRVIPDGVYIQTLNRNGGNISLVGFAESNNRVSSFMRNLDSSYKFRDPNLTKVEANKTLGEQGNRFEMRVKLTKPAVQQNKEEEA